MVWPDKTAALNNRHVHLTRTVADDAPELFTSLDDPAVWANVPSCPQTPQALADVISGSAATGRFMWTIRLPSGQVAGTSSYLDVAPEHARLEIGWTLYGRNFWGTAVNPATKLLLLQHAFHDLLVGRVQLKTDIRNERSQHAIARLGAEHEGVLRRYQRRGDGTVRDSVLFSITAENWPQVRAGLEQRLADQSDPTTATDG